MIKRMKHTDTKKGIVSLHFTVNAESVVSLCRQAWLYEDKKDWAIKTIGYLATGLPMEDIEAILHGIKTLKSTEDGLHCNLVDEYSDSWILEVQSHTHYSESKYYTFANRKVLKELVDTYTEGVVSRLRNAMATPGIHLLSDPTILIELEEERGKLHSEILSSAGFTEQEIEDWRKFNGTDEIRKFADELSDYVDNATGW